MNGMADFKYFKHLIAGTADVDQVEDGLILFYYGLGFSDPVAASSINHYIFSIRKRMVAHLLMKKFKGASYPKWIKKTKPKADIIDDYCKLHGTTRTRVLEKIIEDNKLEFLQEMKVDLKVYKKEHVELHTPEKIVENRWF